MSQAYAAATVDTALSRLKNLERTLAKTQPSAASSLQEGLEETLTVKDLGITAGSRRRSSRRTPSRT